MTGRSRSDIQSRQVREDRQRHSSRMISEDWVAQRLLFSGECETNISMGVFPGVSGVSPGPRGGILTTWVTDNIPRYFEHDFIEILLLGPGGAQAFLTGY